MMDATRPSIDVHVHLHPPRLADAISRHFAGIGWRPVHGWAPDAVASTLREHGVDRFCCFSYAHRPGIARAINAWMAKAGRTLPGAIPFGTVHTDDPDCAEVAREALHDLGLAGLKIHCSVQRIAPDDPRLVPVYEAVLGAGRVMMLHAGTLPYRDEHTGIERVRPVMARFPELPVCIAHLGAHEHRAFLELTDEYPNLYVDTTMALAGPAKEYVAAEPDAVSNDEIVRHQDRILFGSDFPLLPYPYEEERRWAVSRGLSEDVQRKIFYGNAVRFLRLAV
ncbi:MAG: amidohydrolase [Candidatus Rokubacteria bacterium]|nr:amidohydrolase [Candidatus Rokubacteria bacterium]